MATISTTPKVGHIYDQENDTWHPIAGSASPNISYAWTQSHSFAQAVLMANTLLAQRGINNFANTAERAAAIPSPVNGTISYIQSTSTLEFWNGSAWTQLGTTDTTAGALVRRNTNGSIAGSVTGSAASAGSATTAGTLSTARNINGVAFNGSADVVIPGSVSFASGGTTRNGFRRVFVRPGATPPTGTTMDGATLQAGDIYIGY